MPRSSLIDDGPGKPVGINRHIGRRPILAFGNSDGDHQMLQWTAAGSGRRFMGIVHHTDAEREWAYDRTSHIGKLDKAWDEAVAKGWTVVDMKSEWKPHLPVRQVGPASPPTVRFRGSSASDAFRRARSRDARGALLTRHPRRPAVALDRHLL